jgi:hypothetical protein
MCFHFHGSATSIYLVIISYWHKEMEKQTDERQKKASAVQQ